MSNPTTTTFNVSGMTCGHCVSSVTAEVGKIDNVISVDVDLASGNVTVESLGVVDKKAFDTAVDEAGYQVTR